MILPLSVSGIFSIFDRSNHSSMLSCFGVRYSVTMAPGSMLSNESSSIFGCGAVKYNCILFFIGLAELE